MTTQGYTPPVLDLVSTEWWIVDPQVACFREAEVLKFRTPAWYNYALYDRVLVQVSNCPKPTRKKS